MDDVLSIVGLFGLYITLGIAACLPLYHFSFQRLRVSVLWTKILWWIPIFAIFTLVVAFGLIPAILVVVLILAGASREFITHRAYRYISANIYFVLFLIGLAHLPLYLVSQKPNMLHALIIVVFSSVLSDVFAFFFGKYLGRHKLPKQLNDNKSWEGVIGQIVGSILGGIATATLLGLTYSMTLVAAIGIASAVGDLFNSNTKRKINLKDWSQAIPGHGGFLDRFASLSFALATGFWLY